MPSSHALRFLVLVLAILFHPRPLAAQQPPVVTSVWGIGIGGTGPSGFSNARSLITDGSYIYLSDPQNQRILILDQRGGIKAAFSGPGELPGEIREPAGIAFSGPGEIAVADFGGYQIHFFSTGGAFRGRWGEPGLGVDGKLHRPVAVAVDPQARIYVADASDRIQIFTRDGTFVRVLNEAVPLSGVTSMAFGPDGLLYVADGGSRIRKFTTAGALLGTIGGPGSGHGEFMAPLGIGFDGGGNLVVADGGNYRVQRVTRDGAFVDEWGSRGRELGQFNRPTSVALASSGQILIGEDFNSRVQSFCFGAGCIGRTPTPPTLVDCPKLLLHVTPVAAGNACTQANLTDCRDAITTGRCSPSGERSYVYLIVGRTTSYREGLAGIECGITYGSGKKEEMNNGSGIDVLSWTHCATLEFPTGGDAPWPSPGSGNAITWDPQRCGAYTPMVAGYFYVAAYSPDRMFVTPRAVSGLASAATCEAREINLLTAELGYASFSVDGHSPGCNPCVVPDCSAGQTFLSPSVPVEHRSWSHIKALFGR